MNFNLGTLTDWERIQPGELIALDVGAAGFRRVELDLIADAPASAYVTTDGTEDIPVAVGEGLMTVSFTVDRPCALVVLAHADTKVVLRTKARSQEIPESDEASYTTIEPRPSGPSDEVRRMMRIMHLNHERRMQDLRAELLAMPPRQAEERLAEVIDKGDTPAPVSSPAPAPEPEAKE